ncbi:MAG: protein kinase [Atopobiaceae bacterium]|nr:protein kinase [Atopobiaceae bacterium]
MAGTEPVSQGTTFTVNEVPRGSQLHIGDVGNVRSTLGSGAYGKSCVCEFGDARTAVKYVMSAAQQGMARAEYDILVVLHGAGGHAPLALGYGTIRIGAITREALCEELCGGNTLQHVIERQLGDGRPVTAASVSGMGLSIASAVEAIGSQGVRHGDLSHSNVLLRRDDKGAWACTIIDFGQAAQTARPEITSNRPGTVAFSAAEMFPGAKYSRYKDKPSADVYSVGALMLYMRVWARFEKKDQGSYFKRFPTLADGTDAIDEFKRRPLNLVDMLNELGEDADDDDRELSKLISELTEFDPSLRPSIEECVARLSRLAGTRSDALESRHRASIVRRSVRRRISRAIPILRRMGKVALVLWFAYLTFAVCQALYIDFILPAIREGEEVEIDKDSALWHMIDDDFRANDQDTYDPDTPGLREHNPSLSGGHLNVRKYGSMTAYYDSDKYISSDGYELQSGDMAYTDTREVLIVPYKDEWNEVVQPILWGDNQLNMEVIARGGREYVSYRYITPRPDTEIKTVDEYLDDVTWIDGQVKSASYANLDLAYKAGTRVEEGKEGSLGFKEVSCYARRSDTCILEARIVLYADEASLSAVSYDELLEDLFSTIQIKSTNLDEVTASSPYANVVIVSDDGQWQAIIMEDEDFKPYVRKGKEWYYHSVSACTATRYSESFEYDFAPEADADEWLGQGDRKGGPIVQEGDIPANDGMTVRWSLADVGYETNSLNLRVCVQVEDCALYIEGIVPSSSDGEEVVNYLMLETVEISRNQRPVLQVRDE